MSATLGSRAHEPAGGSAASDAQTGPDPNPTATAANPTAPLNPVARVMVDVALAHLDRPFDYRVSAELDHDVRPGTRVRVRFAGRLVDGYVLQRVAASEHLSRLALIERVIGEVPVLTDETAALIRAVADRYGGSFIDVARLAVPARHARTEASLLAATAALSGPALSVRGLSVGPETPAPARDSTEPDSTEPDSTEPDSTEPESAALDANGWKQYNAGESFLAAVRARRPARAVWAARPGEDWPRRIAEAMLVALSAGRGAVAVVPDRRDLARLDAALTDVLGAGRHVALAAELGPARRYRRWLELRLGRVRAVAGTRAAAYAPVHDVGLLILWDDGDDNHREPRAPYPDVRDVLALRSSLTGSALLIGGYTRTTQAQQLVESGWAHEIGPSRDALRSSAPRVVATGDDFELVRDPAARSARLPSLAWRSARDALKAGTPVLVQVTRRGYVPSLACVRDRTPARCQRCSGPLAAATEHGQIACRWCGHPATSWACPVCGGARLRAVTVGALRTAEELGRAFPGTLVRTSGGDSVLDQVQAGPALVVATAGAEPVAVGGYGAALLLDGWSMLARQDLRAAEEAFRRWANAAALVRAGGVVVISADASIPAVQALVRWDPVGFATRELAERSELGLPPAVRLAALSGPAGALQDLIDRADLPVGADLIGPVGVGAEGEQRLLIRVPRASGAALAAALHTASGLRSARKAADPVKVVLDPVELI